MEQITVEIWDTTGTKRQLVQVPSDAPINRFIAVLVERLNLPRHSPDGQPMSYKLHHRGSGRQLLETDTLLAAGVRDCDVMRLQPEITAGGAPTVSAGTTGRPEEAEIRPVPLRVDPTAEDRFARFELIGWWEQERLRRAKVLVVGAGALGNEILKNLALLGIGQVFIADLDIVEGSNLSRAVLFRAEDCGQPKAEVAARAAKGMYPDMRLRAWRGNVVHDLGLGVFRWADVIIGGLDNREARVAINSGAARVGRLWVDGAIERLEGVARVFDPATGPCYECTMNDADWRALAARRSCALLTRAEMADGKVPTTPTTASVIAAIQCQEVVKYIHGLETIAGQGFVFEGRMHQSYLVSYTRKPDCAAHELWEPVIPLEFRAADTPAAKLLALARRELGPDTVLDLGRDMLCALDCGDCGTAREMFSSLGRVTEAEARCHACGGPCTPRLYSTIRADAPFLDRTLAELGIPAWEIIAARGNSGVRAYELAGDRAEVLGGLAEGNA